MKLNWTTYEIATALEKNIKTVQNWIKRGKLNATKINNRYFVSNNALKEFLSEKNNHKKN